MNEPDFLANDWPLMNWGHWDNWAIPSADIMVVEYDGVPMLEYSFLLHLANDEWVSFNSHDMGRGRITKTAGKITLDLRGLDALPFGIGFVPPTIRDRARVRHVYLDVIPPSAVHASRTIFVDANNTRIGNGTWANPYKSLEDALNVAKRSDTIILADGVYHGSFTLPPGTYGRPTTLRAAAGAKPVITPTIPFNANWRVHRGNIYIADIGDAVRYIDPTNMQLFVDGVSMVEARYPNLPTADMSGVMDGERLITQQGTNNTTLILPERLPFDITGATIVAWPGQAWSSEVSTIASVNGTTARLARAFEADIMDYMFGGLVPGNAFYLTNSLALLDAPGEYFYDARTGRLYFYAPGGVNPNTLNLSLRSVERYALRLSHFSTVDGINVYGGEIEVKGNFNTVENCIVRYADHFYTKFYDINIWDIIGESVMVYGDFNVIKSNIIGPTAGTGIHIRGGAHNIITNNFIHDVCYAGNWFGGILFSDSRYTEISHNTIADAGRDLIRMGQYNYNVIINNNLLTDAMRLAKDGGAFFTNIGIDGGGTLVYNNMVVYDETKMYHAGIWKQAVGLYVDNDGKNISFRNNIVIGASVGMNASFPHENLQYTNNTIIGAEYGHAMFAQPGYDPFSRGLVFTNNLYVGLTASDFWFTSLVNGEYIWNEANFDRNGGLSAVDIYNISNMTSSGNTRGTVDAQFRPTGNTPNVGAIPRGGTMFEYGARIPNVTTLTVNASGVHLYNFVNRVWTRGPAIRLGEEVTFIRHVDATWDLVRYQSATWHVRRNQLTPTH
jgi:hypothetical protein